jgi:hypothetical protein
MSWIPAKHRKLYTAAATALYIDLKTVTKNIVTKTSDIISTGYEKIKDNYNTFGDSSPPLDKKINSDMNIASDMNIDSDSICSSEEFSINSVLGEDFISRTDFNEFYNDGPEVLIKINRKRKNITKIWIIENGVKTQIKGKISSYPYINNIIHNWFVYENKIRSRSNSQEDKINSQDKTEDKTLEDKWRWYPTLELYTKYRESSNGVLKQIDMILFKQFNGTYLPFSYNQSD